MLASHQGRPIKLEKSWLRLVQDEFNKPSMKALKAFLLEEKKKFVVYPKGSQIFEAFNLTPFDQVKVVILGQDPYHGPNQAHGLSFSVSQGVKPPPSLINIFNELKDDLHLPLPKTAHLASWAKQGVFLLNTVLTVRAKSPSSHQNRGWEPFTDQVITLLNQKKTNLVFILWGRQAASKKPLINEKNHLVLSSPHPSPYSARNGFFGSKPFSKTNHYLSQTKQTPIDWSL